MEIRPVELNDNEALAIAVRKVLIEMGVPKVGTAYEDKELDAMYESYSQSRFQYYVVENQGNIMGGAGIAPLKDGDPSVCELQKMYFLPEARGKGLGKKMIHLCLDFAKANDFQLCYIETMPNMLDAQALYQKVGFKYIDHPMGNTGHTSCPVWLIKSLV
ncbi:GNAT family N-acetyltransferase [Flavobacteriaceae bacterium]|jgi:putative acetyltransferase|nr:GNAT family N-acetyltransferase [Flavobacteriaceae bacterium]MDA7808267.1 GNAT family N-acetyltransferase [Flavobacteriaceae bacterium]MDA8644612.1 GNAT family N-acetyltransferase [Flavobacteriaceae bacterium]MDA9037396.1 GNAT family N-acetyltransferase [Flavobacteriaceae bacterium]MDA9851351.1 GNAT family N-acetyltransferase [Flavobacteriaceae bacterium]